MVTVLSIGIVVLLICASVFAFSILQGAGRPIGEAGIIESAPLLARVLPSLLLRILLFRRGSVYKDLDAELQSLIEEKFMGADTATDRVRCLFAVLRESSSLFWRALQLRKVAEPKVYASSLMILSRWALRDKLDSQSGRKVIPNPYRSSSQGEVDLVVRHSDGSRSYIEFKGATGEIRDYETDLEISYPELRSNVIDRLKRRREGSPD